MTASREEPQVSPDSQVLPRLLSRVLEAGEFTRIFPCLRLFLGMI